jgi:DNA-binding XRE family transcriptional regulator
MSDFLPDLDTPLGAVTARQLLQMIEHHFADYFKQQEPTKNDKRYVSTYTELAKVLGVSRSTIYRLDKEHLLDEAITYVRGGIKVIDIEKAVDIWQKNDLKGRRARTRKVWRICNN